MILQRRTVTLRTESFKMKLFLAICILKFVESSIYNENGGQMILSKESVVFEEEGVESKLSCSHKCLRLRSDVLYNGSTCRCVKISLIKNAENNVYLKVYGQYAKLMVRHSYIYDRPWPPQGGHGQAQSCLHFIYDGTVYIKNEKIFFVTDLTSFSIVAHSGFLWFIVTSDGSKS